ncbi:hypothetical protein PVAND_006013 [Polypedilum vanderplanki]|uniref:Spp2/MOS2 G-patch domain-containing protein n=1 Tax=Polypedilum vanderplanki TaxID=319348 RepID=A0A9J6C1W1_POLVA|nr:hypothetical protein PVAND_006013 [Polypedilum vanderplanki]
MSNQGAKLSFGFSKVIKKPNLLKSNSENTTETKKIQLIDSIEGTKLKVLGKNPEDDKQKELVIPLTDEQKSTPISKLIETRRKKRSKNNEIKESTETNGNSEEIVNNKEETLEQRAAREILEDLQNSESKNETKVFELPIHPDELPLLGATESTIDDYDRIPIADFGKAMLRGMGWKEEKKDEKDDPNKFDIFVRPKGLGLGADKVVKKQKLLVNPAPNEILEIKKNACIKVLAGKHKNLYGTIEGFDDGGGRLIVKLAIGGLKVQMNEFMVQPVSKQEYAKYSKILNSEKYDEYKNEEGKNSNQKIIKKEDNSPSPIPKKRDRSKSPSTSRARDRSRSYERESKSNKFSERDRSRDRKRDRSPHYSRKKYSSDSEDDKTNNRKYNEKHRKSRSHDREKHKRRHSSSDSNSERYNSKKKSSKKSSKSKSKRYSSDDEKVHKKKYKRSKHHRDRS